MIITFNELRTVMPQAPLVYVDPLNAALEEFSIDNPDRLAAFLANVAVESQQLCRTVENLNYSVARLMAVWPTRFRNPAEALPFSMQPQKLANFVYAGRNGNGNMQSGDGWLFRGMGSAQITGRATHEACATYFQIPLDQLGDWLQQPEGACRSAGWYWYSRALGHLADAGQFSMIVRRWSGALDSLDQRTPFWNRAKTVLA